MEATLIKNYRIACLALNNATAEGQSEFVLTAYRRNANECLEALVNYRAFN